MKMQGNCIDVLNFFAEEGKKVLFMFFGKIEA